MKNTIKDIILKGITLIAVMLVLVGMTADGPILESELFFVPGVMALAGMAWIGLFCKANEAKLMKWLNE